MKPKEDDDNVIELPLDNTDEKERKKHPIYYLFAHDISHARRGGWHDMVKKYKRFNTARFKADEYLRQPTVTLVQVVHINSGKVEYQKMK